MLRLRAYEKLQNLVFSVAEARKAFEEALAIYEDFAKQDPDQFSPLVEWMKKLLKHLPK